MLKEWFRILPGDASHPLLSTLNRLCPNTTETITLSNLPAGTTTEWLTSHNVSIVSQSATQVTVRPFSGESQGQGWVVAKLSNGQEVIEEFPVLPLPSSPPILSRIEKSCPNHKETFTLSNLPHCATTTWSATHAKILSSHNTGVTIRVDADAFGKEVVIRANLSSGHSLQQTFSIPRHARVEFENNLLTNFFRHGGTPPDPYRVSIRNGDLIAISTTAARKVSWESTYGRVPIHYPPRPSPPPGKHYAPRPQTMVDFSQTKPYTSCSENTHHAGIVPGLYHVLEAKDLPPILNDAPRVSMPTPREEENPRQELQLPPPSDTPTGGGGVPLRQHYSFISQKPQTIGSTGYQWVKHSFIEQELQLQGSSPPISLDGLPPEPREKTGIVEVRVTVSNECSCETKAGHYLAFLPTIRRSVGRSDVQISPNPADDFLSISITLPKRVEYINRPITIGQDPYGAVRTRFEITPMYRGASTYSYAISIDDSMGNRVYQNTLKLSDEAAADREITSITLISTSSYREGIYILTISGTTFRFAVRH